MAANLTRSQCVKVKIQCTGPSHRVTKVNEYEHNTFHANFFCQTFQGINNINRFSSLKVYITLWWQVWQWRNVGAKHLIGICSNIPSWVPDWHWSVNLSIRPEFTDKIAFISMTIMHIVFRNSVPQYFTVLARLGQCANWHNRGG